MKNILDIKRSPHRFWLWRAGKIHSKESEEVWCPAFNNKSRGGSKGVWVTISEENWGKKLCHGHTHWYGFAVFQCLVLSNYFSIQVVLNLRIQKKSVCSYFEKTVKQRYKKDCSYTLGSLLEHSQEDVASLKESWAKALGCGPHLTLETSQ